MPRGLKPHTHAQREAVVRELVPLLRLKFGDNLLGVAATGSFARGDDRAYSDLELTAFLRDPPAPGEDRFLQRVVDGMLVEVEYSSQAEYVALHGDVTPGWFLSGAAPLVPLHGAEAVARVSAALAAVRHPRERFLRRAGRRFLEVQESFGKVLNAVEAGNRAGLPILVFDAVLHALVLLSFVNERPYTTLAEMVAEGRRLPLRPPRFGELLDRVEHGTYTELEATRELFVEVFEGLERLMEEQGAALYDDSLDPRLPNRRYD